MQQWLMERAGHLGVLLFLLIGGAVAVPAQSLCDPSKPIALTPWDRYHERAGARCEGVYGEQPVSGDIIGAIASFTLGQPAYELDLRPVKLQWPDAIDGPVQVRAVGLREDLLYQMDTLRPAGTSSYVWPSEVLVHRKIQPDEIGVRVWVERTLLGRPRALHLPLRVGQDEAAAAGGAVEAAERYWLVVVPGAALRKLEVAISRLKTAGAAATTSLDAGAWPLQEVVPYHDFDRGYYAAKRPFRFALPLLSDPGYYRLRLRAERDRDGEPDTESFWFVHVVP